MKIQVQVDIIHINQVRWATSSCYRIRCFVPFYG